MLRRFLAIAAFTLLATPVLATPTGWTGLQLPDPQSRTDLELAGKVKSIEIRTETVGTDASSNNIEMTYFFDGAGVLIKSETRDRAYLAQIRTYHRDPKSQQLVIKIQENMAVDRAVIDLKERGKVVCVLDAAGRVVSLDHRDWMGESRTTWERDYDPNGRVVAERRVSPEGEILSLCLSNFASPTQERREFYGGKVGEVPDLEQAEETLVIETDAQGRPLVTLIDKPGEVQTRVEHRYTPEGRPAEDIHFRLNQQVERHVWTYDEHGNALTHSWTGPRKSSLTESFTYQYDDHGNWTWRRHASQTVALGEELPLRTEVTRRTIAYYS